MRKSAKCAIGFEEFKKEYVPIVRDHTQSSSVWLSPKEDVNFRNLLPPLLVVVRTSRGRSKASFEPEQSRLGMEQEFRYFLSIIG